MLHNRKAPSSGGATRTLSMGSPRLARGYAEGLTCTQPVCTPIHLSTSTSTALKIPFTDICATSCLPISNGASVYPSRRSRVRDDADLTDTTFWLLALIWFRAGLASACGVSLRRLWNLHMPSRHYIYSSSSKPSNVISTCQHDGSQSHVCPTDS